MNAVALDCTAVAACMASGVFMRHAARSFAAKSAIWTVAGHQTSPGNVVNNRKNVSTLD